MSGRLFFCGCFFVRQVEARSRLRWALGRLGEHVDAEGERRDGEGEGAASRTPGGEGEGGEGSGYRDLHLAENNIGLGFREPAASEPARYNDTSGEVVDDSEEKERRGGARLEKKEGAAGAAVTTATAATAATVANTATGASRGGGEAGGALSSPPVEGYFSPRLAFGRPMYESASPRTEDFETHDERVVSVRGNLTRGGGGGGGGDDHNGAPAVAAGADHADTMAKGEYREPNWRSMVPVLFPPGWRDRELAAAAGEGAAPTTVDTAENLAPRTGRSLERSTERFPVRPAGKILERSPEQPTKHFVGKSGEYAVERSTEAHARASVKGQSSLPARGRSSSGAALGSATGDEFRPRDQALSAPGGGGRWVYGADVEGTLGEQGYADGMSFEYEQGREAVGRGWPGGSAHYELVEFGDAPDGRGGGGGGYGGGGGDGGGGDKTRIHGDVSDAATGLGPRTVAHGFTRETFAAEHARLVMNGQRSPLVRQPAPTHAGVAAPEKLTARSNRGHEGGSGVGVSRPRPRRAEQRPAATAAATAALSSSTARRRQQRSDSLGARGAHPPPGRRVTRALQAEEGAVVGGVTFAAGRVGRAESRPRRGNEDGEGNGRKEKEKKTRRQRVSVHVPMARRAQDSVSGVPCCSRRNARVVSKPFFLH